MTKLVFAAAAMATVFLVAPAMACDTVTSSKVPLTACVDAAGWALQAAQGDQEFLYYSTDETIGFTIISEKETVAVADYRAAILANAAAAAADSKPENVTILSERVENIGGKAWNVIEYQVATPDQPILFQNFYYVQPGFGSTQFVYWSAPESGTSAAYRAGQMLSTVAFTQ